MQERGTRDAEWRAREYKSSAVSLVDASSEKQLSEV